MEYYNIIRNDKVIKCDITHLNIDFLKRYADNENICIYVCRNDAVIGIIGKKELFMSLEESVLHINEKFSYLLKEDEEAARQIFDAKPMIKILPVLDDEKRIVCEYIIDRDGYYEELVIENGLNEEKRDEKIVEGEMKRKVVIWGCGQVARKWIDRYMEEGIDERIMAIVDSNTEMEQEYKGIPIVRPISLTNICFEEVWVGSYKYYSEIRGILLEEYGVVADRVKRIGILPILEAIIRRRYVDFFRNGIELKDKELNQVLCYLKNNSLDMYCYEWRKKYNSDAIDVFWDDKCEMFYTLVEEKRMYLSKILKTSIDAKDYVVDVIAEQDMESPHCYGYKNEFYQNITNIVDVGAAEGIWGLRLVEYVQHLWLIEADPAWAEALECTFAPFRNKVTIISKYASDNDSEKECTLDTLFSEQKIDLIKVDVEGAEEKVLRGATELNQKISGIKWIVCAYHYQEDNKILSELLKNQGFSVENSPGYILAKADCGLDNKEIDFRRGLIFAEKN